jgi:N-acetylglucosamine kinase-like BadF-type ATPase
VSDHIYIGIDGGGTHTRALAGDASGKILGVGHAGSSNRNHYPREAVRQNLGQAVREAIDAAGNSGTVRCAFLGMCAVSTEADKNDIVSIAREVPELKSAKTIRVENDTHTGLAGGLSGRPGCVLIAGTGSACLGVRADGKSYLCGGWGALADDVGSAPWIGTKAIQAAVMSEDGRIGPTLLRDIVFKFLELEEPRELLDRVHNRGLEREQIGKLAPLTIQAYQKGDAVAAEILRDAAAQLSRTIATTARKLEIREKWELILVGGLALSGPPFQTMLIEKIVSDTPVIRVVEPEMPPVKGALLEAIRCDGVAATAGVLQRLKDSAIAVK